MHHELFEEISTTNLSKNITLLVNLYGYAEEYLKYFTEMKNERQVIYSVIERKFELRLQSLANALKILIMVMI